MVNRCVLDSILWFHTECPKDASAFDDPVEFKRKFRDFFAANKTIADNASFRTETDKRIRKEYGYQSGYAEDMKPNKKVMKYMEEFAKYSPNAQPVDMEEEDPDGEIGIKAITKNSDAVYDRKLEYL